MSIRLRIESAIGAAQYHALTRSVARVTGFREDAAVIDGLRVPFLIRGWGAPIVLVHGFGGDKESWLLMARFLRTRATILIPDLPGFGRASLIPPERASAKQQSAILVGLLDRLGFARAHLVGNSMGGGISARTAYDHPELVTSLTLIGSVGPLVEKSDVGRAFDQGVNPLVIEEGDAVNGIDKLMALVAERSLPSTRAMRRYLGEQRAERREHESRTFRGWYEPAKGEGIPLDLESIHTPTLVIHGAKDRVIHPATARAYGARLPDVRLLMMEGVGHVPQMEAPEAVARAIDALVGEVERRRAA